MNSTLSISAPADRVPDSLWLNNRKWDLTFISLSAICVLLPFFAYEAFQYVLGFASVQAAVGIGPRDVMDFSRNTVNAMIALLIGGPHMYATYSRTFMDGAFRKQHVGFLLGSLLLPFLVIYLGVMNFQLLVTIFFFWASVHILHQIGYIIDCYGTKQPAKPALFDRIVDYTVVFSSLYPIGVWRMVSDNFMIGQIRLLLPDFMLIRVNPVVGWGMLFAATAIFTTSLAIWLRRSYLEYRAGTLHTPKFILMALTVVVAFFIPAYHELDVAFQGFNTWHSIQYLGLTLYINRLREKRDGISTPLIRRMSQAGRGWRFYFFNVMLALSTVGLISILLVFKETLGFSFDQCYYIVVLSVLLMHYYHDHLLFTQTDIIAGK